MIIKATFKSHFKIKKNFKKNFNKFIFVKNIVIFFLFFKVFLKNCSISLSFSNKKQNKTSLLKAPSRHKKFFHQICFENFVFKTYFYFFDNPLIGINDSIGFFKKINNIFEKFGNNTLSKTNFRVIFNIKHEDYFTFL